MKTNPTPNQINPSELISSLNRRSFLRRAGTVAALMPFAGVLGSVRAFGEAPPAAEPGFITPVDGPRDVTNQQDIEILNFALNLEYLESEYYLYATTGKGLKAYGVDTTGVGTLGTVTVKSNPMVNFTDATLAGFAMEIAHDEANHVRFLRTALGSNAIAEPSIDLTASFNTLAQAAGLGASFDPFANELNFLIGGFIFEDVGVTAYHGASTLISDKAVLEYAAGILGVEAYHASLLRTVLYLASQKSLTLTNPPSPYPNIVEITNKISQLRADLSQASDDFGITFETTSRPFIVPTDSNAQVFSRTVRQVLNIVYGGVGASKGLFFPDGVNETPLTFP
jgi:hypothetical protein